MVESSDKELNVEARKQRLQVEKKLWKTSLALVLVQSAGSLQCFYCDHANNVTCPGRLRSIDKGEL